MVRDIEGRAKKVQSSAEIAEIGTIASSGDRTVGEMVAEAMKKVGHEGVITEAAGQPEDGHLIAL